MTAPMIAGDVDLRGYGFMPLYGNHLFGSDFNAAASDAAWRAGVTLWWAAWNQVPAGSLPDDDVALCRLADLGRDMKGWKKIREQAMRGFVLCEDGRHYHPFLCRLAEQAWERRGRERDRKAKWRRSKAEQETGTETGTEGGTAAFRDAKERERERERKEEDQKRPPAAASGDPVKDLIDAGIATLGAAGVPEKQARSVIGMVRRDLRDDLVVAELLAKAQADAIADPVAWLRKAVAARKRPADAYEPLPGEI